MLKPHPLLVAQSFVIQRCSTTCRTFGSHLSTTLNVKALAPYLFHAFCKNGFRCFPAAKSAL